MSPNINVITHCTHCWGEKVFPVRRREVKPAQQLPNTSATIDHTNEAYLSFQTWQN